MDDLRRMLAARGDQPAPQVTVIHETRNIEPEKPIVRRIEPQHSDHVPLKYNKWNMLASGAEPENKVFSPQSVEPAKKVEFVEEILPTEEVKEPEPEPKPEPEPVRELPKREIKLKPAAEPIVVKEPEPEPIVVKEPEPVEPTVSYVQIVFNSETSHLPAGISEIAVDVPSELSTDDIVFEIRKKAAVKVLKAVKDLVELFPLLIMFSGKGFAG